MGKFIHISIRRNLLYLVNLIIFYYLRKVDLIIINTKFNFNDSLIFTLLMFFGEFFAGLAIQLYQTFFIKEEINKKNNNINIFNNKASISESNKSISLSFSTDRKKKKKKRRLGVEFILKKPKMKRPDNILKIILLIFFSASFDFIEFAIATFYIPRFSVVSPTAEYRFGGIIIIIATLLCRFAMKIKILKHQFYSLIIIGICLLIIITLEIIYRGKGVSFADFAFAHILVIGYLIFVPFTDIIEKYLIDFNFISPFIILMAESIFGFIFISIYSAGEDPFEDIKRIYRESSDGEFVLLIFLLFLYFAFSGGVNVYKILVNGLYSPMAKTLAVYILNPFLYLYYFIIGNDFISNNERNYFYFIVNMIIALIVSFFGCVFNEFLVLSFCGLEHETHYSVSRRASNYEIIKDLKLMEESEDSSIGE